jgi:diguanylate cyclase (GGDEF)-like protein
MEQTFGWIVAAACALGLAAAIAWQRSLTRRALARASRAERTLALLGSIAPALTQAATESEPLTCERIAERFQALVPVQTFLCVIARGGQLVVGAKSDGGFAGFLRIGDPCDGDSIVDWAAEHGRTALIGPDRELPPDAARPAGPLVGSRDRVWALCVPMLQQRGHGLRPRLVGLLYAERKREEPFTDEDLSTAELIARFSTDALLRAQFSDDAKRASEIDQLTGLLSPVAFRRRLRQVIDDRTHPAEGERADVALFFIDSDKFKLWNDSFGHVVGDRVLKRMAQIFGEVAASGGFAGRNGGDEFCIALLDRTKDDAVEVAEQLRARVERTDLGAAPDGGPSPRIPATISIGVAHFPVDVPITAAAPSDVLLESADARMYDAKRAGGNRVAYSRTRALPTKLRYPGEGPIARR